MTDKPLMLAGVIQNSIVDGPGIRMTVFTQGCLLYTSLCAGRGKKGGSPPHPAEPVPAFWRDNQGGCEVKMRFGILCKMTSSPLLTLYI